MYAAKDSKHGVYGELFKYDYVAKVVAFLYRNVSWTKTHKIVTETQPRKRIEAKKKKHDLMLM